MNKIYGCVYMFSDSVIPREIQGIVHDTVIKAVSGDSVRVIYLGDGSVVELPFNNIVIQWSKEKFKDNKNNNESEHLKEDKEDEI